MHTISLIFIFIIVIIILVISLTYATDASVAVGQSAARQTDPDLSAAYFYLTWTVSILWIVISLIIIGVIALIIFGPEFLPIFGKTLVYLVLAFMVIAIIVVGVISSIAAFHINRSPENSTVGSADEDAIIAAVVSLGSIGLVGVGYAITWYANKAPGSDGMYDNIPPQDTVYQ